MTKRMTASRSTVILAAVALLAVGCGDGSVSDPPTRPATLPTAVVTDAAEPELRVVVLGDSLAAGLGLPADLAFPALVEAALRERGLDVEVVNAGVSGDTSAGGLARLEWVLRRPADVLIVELGGNDALRGRDLAATEANLRELVRRGRAAGSTVVLLGMDVPTNYGPDYGAAFAALYPRVAEEEGAILVPGFVRDLVGDPLLIQPDGLHPTAAGQQRLARTLLPTLAEVLADR